MTHNGLHAAKAELVEVAAAVVSSGAISLSGHGNVSIRLPGRDQILYTAAPTLRDFDMSAVAHIALNGQLLSGHLPQLSAAVVEMHTAVYRERDDVGCVIHTHSPFATAHAVAHRPIGCWAEPFVIFGLEAGVPVVPYAPRGSAEAISHIRTAIDAERKALLLANHGVLAFDATPEDTVRVGVLVEEAAQLGIYAELIGGHHEIPR